MCWYFFYFCPIKETIVACKQQTVIRKPRNAEKQFTKFQSRAPSHDVNCSYVSQARQLIYISPSHAHKSSIYQLTELTNRWILPPLRRMLGILRRGEPFQLSSNLNTAIKKNWRHLCRRWAGFFFNMSNDSFLINVFLLSHFRLEVYPHLCTLRRWQIWRLNLLRCMRAKCSSFRYALLRLLNLWMLPL